MNIQLKFALLLILNCLATYADAEEVPTEPAESATIDLDKSEKKKKKKGKRKGDEIMKDANNERVGDDGEAKQKKKE